MSRTLYICLSVCLVAGMSVSKSRVAVDWVSLYVLCLYSMECMESMYWYAPC